MRSTLKTRLRKLEAGLPDAAEQQHMRERIERARTRIMATMTQAEQAEYLAERAARAERASHNRVPGQRARSVSLADRLRAARTAS